ncbi:MAG TPA: hypothetical protein VIL38_04165, partial [Thermaerobacter sp.]
MVKSTSGNGSERGPRRAVAPRPAAEIRRGGERAGGDARQDPEAQRPAVHRGAGARPGLQAPTGEAASPAEAGGRQPGGGRAARRLIPQPLQARPVSLRAARAGGRPTGPIPLPAYQVAGEGADRTPGPGRAGANRTRSLGTSGPGAGGGTGGGVAGETGAVTGPGPNQKDDIRQSLWVRRPDLFYGKPNRGSHRAAFAEPLAPDRQALEEAGRLEARRRQGVRRVPAARELLPVGEQGAPQAVAYAPDQPAEGRVDRQVAQQLTRRPSPSSQGNPIARTQPAGVEAGTVRWEAAEEPAPAPLSTRG